MNLKLKRIAPLQAGKMLAALYGLMSLIFLPFMLAFMALGTIAAKSQPTANAPALPLMLGMGAGFAILMPVFYAAIGFVGGIVGAWVYNLLGRWIGGFEFDFEMQNPPRASTPAVPRG